MRQQKILTVVGKATYVLKIWAMFLEFGATVISPSSTEVPILTTV